MLHAKRHIETPGLVHSAARHEAHRDASTVLHAEIRTSRPNQDNRDRLRFGERGGRRFAGCARSSALTRAHTPSRAALDKRVRRQAPRDGQGVCVCVCARARARAFVCMSVRVCLCVCVWNALRGVTLHISRIAQLILVAHIAHITCSYLSAAGRHDEWNHTAPPQAVGTQGSRAAAALTWMCGRPSR